MLVLVNSPFTRSKKGVKVQLFTRDLCDKNDHKPCPDSVIQPVSGVRIEAGFEGFDWKTRAETDKIGEAFISFEDIPMEIVFSSQAKLIVWTEYNGKKLQKELRLSNERLTELKIAMELPPRLVTSLSFYDQNGNSVLDADESGEIVLKIKNQGQGIASHVFVQMKPEKAYRDIVFDESALKGFDLGDLKPGQATTLRLKFRAGELVESGMISLLIDVTEANGYDAGTVSLSLGTKAILRPSLIVVQIGIDDSKGNANGVIDKGDLINVKAIVENKGEGRGEKVVARILSNDPNLKLFGAAEFQLGDIEPEGQVPINFSFSTTNRYSGPKDLPITIDFLSKRKIFNQLNQPVALALGEVKPSISSMVIGQAKEPPPTLSYTANLEDINKNRVDLIKGGERYSLRIMIENRGPGQARKVQVVLSGNNRLIEYLQGNRELGDIPPGGKKEVILSGEIPPKIPEQEMDLIVGLNEQRGYGPVKAQRLVVLTRSKEILVETVSRPVDVDILPVASNLPERKDDLAVVIGISEYNKIGTPVKYARHDAEIMREYLHRILGVPQARIKALYDKEATWSGINAALNDYLNPQRVKENSRVYFYYSGHGAPEVKTQKAYLVPADGDLDSPSTLYPVEQVFSRLNAIKAKEAVVMLDSCFAGEGPRSVIPVGARPMGLVVEDPLRATGRVISIAAAEVKQISSDLEGMRHGLFTYFLLKGLRGEGDSNQDGTVRLSELFQYVQSNVTDKAAEMNRDQTPVLNPPLTELGERAGLPFTVLTSRGNEPKERNP
ncbi:MAG: caspase family protein [Nitrospirae bacterium]|nr:caspase family protein [Nitrospirota bacterium]